MRQSHTKPDQEPTGYNILQVMMQIILSSHQSNLFREGAATAGNDFRPPVSSQPVSVFNANYISGFLTYLTPPKT